MKRIIDISEDLYKATINGLNAEEIWDLRVAVKNSTPLPKGHGRLIDAELLDLENLFREDDNGFSLIHTRSEFQTIIEADKAESEE